MLAGRLIRMIEEHAEELTRALLADLKCNPRTPSYHQLASHQIHDRVYNVYRNLGQWLGNTLDSEVEHAYTSLGARRCRERFPLSEVVYALILTKYHLRDYINSSGLVDSAVDLYQQAQLHRLVGQFFDKAIYFTTQGYERETRRESVIPETVER